MATIWSKDYWKKGEVGKNIWKTLTRPGYGWTKATTDFWDKVENGISNWWDQKTNAYSYESQLQNQEYEENLALQQQQQAYDLYASNTENQRAVADMKAAGLNVGAMGGSGSNAAAGGTGLSTQTPSSEAKARSGNNPQNSDLTNALINQTIIDYVTHHTKEIAAAMPKEAGRAASNAKEQFKHYGNT